MNRRVFSTLLAGGSLVLVPATANADVAGAAAPVDVVIRDAPPPHRRVVVAWNPLALVAIGKLSADVVITPADHHGLVLSPFYAWATTRPIFVFDDAGSSTQLPEQRFAGFGAELGYRYYGEKGGPRGFFVGPSLIVGWFNAKAQNGSTTSYVDYGVAADVGYQALIADSVSLSLGGGVQYVAPTRSIPDQQFPASIYANNRVSPRVLFAVGWAF